MQNDPSDYLLVGQWQHAKLVSYADSILFRGCYRGQASCIPPLDRISAKLQNVLVKLDAQFKKYRVNRWCGFGRSRGSFTLASYKYGSTYDLNWVAAPEHKLTDERWDVENFMRPDGTYDGCAGFQQVLDGEFLKS